MFVHAIAAVSLAIVLAAASIAALMALSNANPDKTVGGAYAALAMFVVAPIVFLGTLGAYALGVWIWKG